MLVLRTEEEVDIIEELLKHVCGTCAEAREDDNLPSHKRICREGYGLKHMMNKGCGAWRAIGTDDGRD